MAPEQREHPVDVDRLAHFADSLLRRATPADPDDDAPDADEEKS